MYAHRFCSFVLKSNEKNSNNEWVRISRKRKIIFKERRLIVVKSSNYYILLYNIEYI